MCKLVLEYQIITERNIPVICCYEEGAVNLPLVLINHGTGRSAEEMLTLEGRIAKEGFFCVSIDAVGQGSRSDGKLDEWLQPKVYKKNYLDMLLYMANDMSSIIDYFSDDSRVDITRVGMTGTSQGGYIAFMTMTKDSRITAAAPLIGSPDLEDKYGFSPDWEEIADDVKKEVIKHSPLRNYEKMFPTALLIQASIEDTMVPIAGIRRLDEKLKPLYTSCPENYKFIQYPGIGHEVPNEMHYAVIDWFNEKLKK